LKSSLLKISLLTALFGTGCLAQSISQIGPLLRDGRVDEARRILSRIEQAHSGASPSDTLLFLKALLATDADSASAWFSQLLETVPESPYCDDAHFRLAQSQYARGLYKAAKTHFQTMLRQQPRSPLAQKILYWLGLCHTAMGQPDSATIYLRRVVSEFSYNDLSAIARSDIKRLETVRQVSESNKTPDILYYVQVGAFSRQESALMRKSFFETRGYTVHLRNKWRDGKLLYLVWLGPEKTQEQAQSLGEKLRQKLNIQYLLVSE
jgi:tetratricopeptide (TPR) repeat protein